MRRGEMGMAEIVAAVLAVILILVLVWIYSDTLFGAGESFQECPGYCSQSCVQLQDGRPAGFSNAQGNNWCESGAWELDEERAQAYDKDAGEYSGSELGLQCCQANPWTETPPASFLPRNLRTGETSEDGTIEDRLDIIAYFGERSSPLQNGETIRAISQREYEFELDVSGLDDLPDDAELKCDISLLTTEGIDVLTNEEYDIDIGSLARLNEFCQEGPPTGDPITFPAEFEDEMFTLEVLYTEDEGRYNPSAPHDTRFSANFQVENPIEFDGLSSAWARERVLRLTCDGATCTQFEWALTSWGSSCEDADYSEEGLVYPSPGVGEVVVAESGAHKVCARAQTPAGVAYEKSSEIPVRIDRTPPSLDVSYDFIRLQTQATCSVSSESPCMPIIGSHYITRAVDFVGAIFAGANGAQYCPQDPSAYNRISAAPLEDGTVSVMLPFESQHQFAVLCVMAFDEAGNTNREPVLVYNSYDILSQVANSQQEQGGPGSGYYGYNPGSW